MKSSKLVLTLSIIVAVVSLLVLIVTLDKFGITGRATDTGIANLSIDTTASVAFTDDACYFGSGSVTESPETPFDVAYVYSNGTVVNGTGWGGCDDGLAIVNDGNVNITVTYQSDGAATTLIGDGTGESFKMKASSVTGCGDGTIGAVSYAEIAAATPVEICDDWDLGGTATLDIALEIPEDALPGAKGVVITATGSA